MKHKESALASNADTVDTVEPFDFTTVLYFFK